MRDSRVGSFGVVGLVLLIGAKVLLLGEMTPARAMLAFVSAHAIARWSSLVMIARCPFAASTARPSPTS